MSITKNRQSTSALRSLAHEIFPGRELLKITELTEGMFNAAYRLDFSDGSSILKIAAATAEGLLSNEVNLMQAEVAAMRLARQHGLPGVAQVQHADFSRSRCSGAFFLMDMLPGRSMNACRDELSPETVAHVMRHVGAFQRRLAQIRGDAFGLLGSDERFSTLYDLIRHMFTNVLRDAAARTVPLPVDSAELLARLKSHRAAFAGVEHPSLVHWDMWEGNIFVSDGQLSGVIDWERAMWGEPLMDDRFRRHNRCTAFLEGFGKTAFSPAEMRRILWYDVFLYITMIVECEYRQYGSSPETWSWLLPLLEASWNELES